MDIKYLCSLVIFELFYIYLFLEYAKVYHALLSMICVIAIIKSILAVLSSFSECDDDVSLTLEYDAFIYLDDS